MAIIKDLFDLFPKDSDGIKYTYHEESDDILTGFCRIYRPHDKKYTIKFRGLSGYQAGTCHDLLKAAGAKYSLLSLELPVIARKIHRRVVGHHARAAEAIKKGEKEAQERQDKLSKEQALYHSFYRQITTEEELNFKNQLDGEIKLFDADSRRLEMKLIVTPEQGAKIIKRWMGH